MKNIKLFLIVLMSGFSGITASESNNITIVGLIKEPVTANEQALSNAVAISIIQLSDRQAIYAKQAILLEQATQQAKSEQERECLEDSARFFKFLTLAKNESEIRLLHSLFADKFVACQKAIYVQKVN